MKKKILIICIFLLFLANVLVAHLLLNKNSKKYQEMISSFVSTWQSPKVKIFITYYKPYKVPFETRILEPIQVGRAIEKEPFMGGKLSEKDIELMHQQMIGDDTGDNISAKNRVFDVLTAYYWVWKHYKEIGNPKYIGFFAHRKVLSLSKGAYSIPDISKPDYGYNEKKISDLLEKHAVITSYWIPYYTVGDKKIGVSFYENYKTYHHIEDMDFMIEYIKKNYPEMVSAMNVVLYDAGKGYSAWNFWIMKKELAFDYFEKLFPLVFALEKERGKEIEQYDLEQRRAMGYLAERFFAIWLLHQQKTGVVSAPYYAPVFYL